MTILLVILETDMKNEVMGFSGRGLQRRKKGYGLQRTLERRSRRGSGAMYSIFFNYDLSAACWVASKGINAFYFCLQLSMMRITCVAGRLL